MRGKFTAPLKIMITEELNQKIIQLKETFEVDKSVLIRSLLSNIIDKVIGEANDDNLNVEYSIQISKGRETLVRRMLDA